MHCTLPSSVDGCGNQRFSQFAVRSDAPSSMLDVRFTRRRVKPGFSAGSSSMLLHYVAVLGRAAPRRSMATEEIDCDRRTAWCSLVHAVDSGEAKASHTS